MEKTTVNKNFAKNLVHINLSSVYTHYVTFYILLPLYPFVLSFNVNFVLLRLGMYI